MSNISKLYQEWRALQPLKTELQRRMDQSFMIDFNYNSNHMEGNTLTYGQTKLLLLFGKVKGDALMRDYEEMKAHNTGLEMMKIQALDKERPLSESFLRDLNRIILAGDFYKLSNDGEYRYKIHTGVYKTRPNSVITPSCEMFDYASPEETAALMNDLVRWYNTEEQKEELSPIALATLFHYRYIRIHPFEDGNGRIARLMVNYILHRHGYPMIVIPNADRKKYLEALGKCDGIVGKEPYKGANAVLAQIHIFVDFISVYVKKKLIQAIQIAKGEILEIIETDKKEIDTVNDTVNDTVSIRILNLIEQKPEITINEIVTLTGVSRRTVTRRIDGLKSEGVIERAGSDKTGYWIIK